MLFADAILKKIGAATKLFTPCATVMEASTGLATLLFHRQLFALECDWHSPLSA